MRIVRFFFLYLLVTVFGLTLILFLAQNRREVRLDFFGPEFSVNLAWVLLGAAAFSAFIVLVFLLPGRIAAAMHSWSLERDLRAMEQELGRLQAQRERLLARHDHLLEAHERLLFTHQRLISERDRSSAEREQAFTYRATPRSVTADAAPQAVRETTAMPRAAVIGPASRVTAGVAVPSLAAATAPHSASVDDMPHASTLSSQGQDVRVAATPAARIVPDSHHAEPMDSVRDDTARLDVARPAGQPLTSLARQPAVVQQELAAVFARFVVAARAHARSQAAHLAALADRLRDDVGALRSASTTLIASLQASIAAWLARLQRSSARGGPPSGSQSHRDDHP